LLLMYLAQWTRSQGKYSHCCSTCLNTQGAKKSTTTFVVALLAFIPME
jgi:hypothetical protein